MTPLAKIGQFLFSLIAVTAMTAAMERDAARPEFIVDWNLA
ncbi:hypothetical protein R3X27_00235 [Tropicimonas sp. TH_r6]|nr:hypothetical protein [Tropicimonas sp. TH_r6]MDV7141097.1 hypothetical protein [Tropicimonas sp. TH_r6]